MGLPVRQAVVYQSMVLPGTPPLETNDTFYTRSDHLGVHVQPPRRR